VIHCVILSMEYGLNSGQFGVSWVQQPGGFLDFNIPLPPGDDGGSGTMCVVSGWL